MDKNELLVSIPRLPVQQWEYYVSYRWNTDFYELGQQGWELVTAIHYSDQYQYIFKRPKQ